MSEVLYLSNIDEIINITKEQKEALIESISTRLLEKFINGDMYKNGILTLEVNINPKNEVSPINPFGMIIDTTYVYGLTWTVDYNNKKYSATAKFNYEFIKEYSKNYKEEKLMIIELILNQIIKTLEKVKLGDI